jgi:hypothetical protein
MNKDVECPYCGAWNEVCHDDGQGYEEDIKHEMECCECEKRFVFTTYISFSYESEKADCLNDGKHDFRPTITCPKICTKMQCTLCDEEREPTTEEWRKILTPDEFAKAKTEYQWITKL